MKKSLFFAATLTLLLASCGPNRQERIDAIEAFEDSIMENSILATREVADQIIPMYIAFADKYPNDSLAPIYLMKAGETASNVLETSDAIEYFDRIIANYPDFSEVPMCFFLKGNAYELNNNIEEARAAYQEFIDKYPTHWMADQIQKSLPYLGMPAEEMLEHILAEASAQEVLN